MANRLKVAKVLSIKQLHDQGWSQRRTARELGISRDAVARHLAKAASSGDGPPKEGDSNKATPGRKAPTGSNETSDDGSTPPLVAEVSRSRSLCCPFREIIIAKLERGLSAQRIYQDLVEEQGFEGKYHSVRRFVAKLNQAKPLPFRRIEVASGEEAQIDFGSGALVIGEDGKRCCVSRHS